MSVVEVVLALCNHAETDDVAYAIVRAALAAQLVDNGEADYIAETAELN